jgi:hypothetical protein
MLEENQKIYQQEEYTRTHRKLPNIGWRRSKYTRLKNLTMYFLLMKTLLAKKIQLEEGNLKLNF